MENYDNNYNQMSGPEGDPNYLGPESNVEIVEEIDSFEAMVGVFTHPVTTMKRLVYTPKRLMAILILMAVSVVPYIINFNAYVSLAIQNGKLSESITGVALSAAQLEQNAIFQTYVGAVVAPISSLIGWLLFSLVIFALVKLFGANRATYKQVSSVVAHALYIKVVAIIILSILQLFTRDYSFSLSLSYVYQILLGGKNLIVATLLSSFEVFKILQYCLIGFGVYAIGGFTKKKATILMVVLFVLVLVYQTGNAALSLKMVSNIQDLYNM